MLLQEMQDCPGPEACFQSWNMLLALCVVLLAPELKFLSCK